MILAVDPGPTQSAFVVYDFGKPVTFGKLDNLEMLERVSRRTGRPEAKLVIEMIASYGMPVGREVFETCVWIGRFLQAFGSAELVYRRDVKLHLCGQARAKDGNVRQALIDRYGGKEVAIGRKAAPGPLYGISADVWQALAVAVTYDDQHTAGPSIAADQEPTKGAA